MTADVEALTERIRQALDEGEAMQCTRVWEAWHYRTMSDEDFVDASDGPLAEEIAAAVLPIVESMVRKAKAEALREAADILECHPLDEPDAAHTPNWLYDRAVEYETGDRDEHR